jgi:hypothetical protein
MTSAGRAWAALPSAAALMDQAAATTGLTDFGQGTFREGLGVLLDSLDTEARLTPAGVREIAATLLRRLENRLAVQEWYRTHPDTGQQQIGDPVCITGLPRTGTSALVTLLSLDPAFRPMRSWEMDRPCPPPVLGEESYDPRRLAMLAQLERARQANPRLAAMHVSEIDGAEEDVEVIGMEFKAQTCTAPAFSYHAWWRDCDMRPAYAYHRRISRLLQSRRGPDRWLLKAPHYVFHLRAVLDAYPGARFIVTHRDPVKTLPSWASLTTSLYPSGSLESFAPGEIGPHLAAHQVIGMQRLIEIRNGCGDNRFLDITHREFAADPLGIIERVYQFLGLDLPGATRVRMLAWTRNNVMGAHGAHRYTPEEFGLSAASLRADFAFYTSYFDVPLDA